MKPLVSIDVLRRNQTQQVENEDTGDAEPDFVTVNVEMEDLSDKPKTNQSCLCSLQGCGWPTHSSQVLAVLSGRVWPRTEEGECHWSMLKGLLTAKFLPHLVHLHLLHICLPQQQLWS